MAPPLPIPNREVKRNSAHDTSTAGKIGRRQNIFVCKDSNQKSSSKGAFFVADLVPFAASSYWFHPCCTSCAGGLLLSVVRPSKGGFLYLMEKI